MLNINEKIEAAEILLNGIQHAIGQGAFKEWDQIELLVKAKHSMESLFREELPNFIRLVTAHQQLEEAVNNADMSELVSQPAAAATAKQYPPRQGQQAQQSFEVPKTIKRK